MEYIKIVGDSNYYPVLSKNGTLIYYQKASGVNANVDIVAGAATIESITPEPCLPIEQNPNIKSLTEAKAIIAGG